MKRGADKEISKDHPDAFCDDSVNDDDTTTGGVATKAVLQQRRIVRARRPLVAATTTTAAATNDQNDHHTAPKGIFAGINLLAASSASSSTSVSAPPAFRFTTTTSQPFSEKSTKLNATAPAPPATAAAAAAPFIVPTSTVTTKTTKESQNSLRKPNVSFGSATTSTTEKKTKTSSSSSSLSEQRSPEKKDVERQRDFIQRIEEMENRLGSSNPLAAQSVITETLRAYCRHEEFLRIQKQATELPDSTARTDSTTSHHGRNENAAPVPAVAGAATATAAGQPANAPVAPSAAATFVAAPTLVAPPPSAAAVSSPPVFTWGASPTATTAAAPATSFSFVGSNSTKTAKPNGDNESTKNQIQNDGDAAAGDATENGDELLPPAVAARTIDTNWDDIASYPKVIFYHKKTSGGSFEKFVEGELRLQRLKANPNHQRMVMRDALGLKVLVNMKIESSNQYEMNEQKNKKGVTYGQILFMGCNDSAKGMEPFAMKASLETAQALSQKLRELRGSTE